MALDQSKTYSDLNLQPPHYERSTPPSNRSRSNTPSLAPRAGVIYAPATYPTPELLSYPTGRHYILDRTRNFTSVTIQAALNSLGDYGTLYLPQKSRWAVSNAIILRSHQELATWGYPTDEQAMAQLKAESTCNSHLLKCDGTKGMRVRNLVIDGGREEFGPSEKCQSMVVLGGEGGESQSLDRCILKHPRNWGCLQVRGKGAVNVRVTNNIIGPSGNNSKPAKGIFYAAVNGLIAGNYIRDATEEAIGVYGAAGTLVTSNTIVTQTRISAVGVRMDFHPLRNHEWTRVVHNTIRIEGAYLKVGISQGSSVLQMPDSKSPKQVLRGGTVMHNLIESRPSNKDNPGVIGYGFAISNVENWTCTDNVSAPSVTYGGNLLTPDRRASTTMARPGPFVRSVQARIEELPAEARNYFQNDFCEANVMGLARITPA